VPQDALQPASRPNGPSGQPLLISRAMKKLLVLPLALLAAAPLGAAPPSKPAAAPASAGASDLKTEEEKTLYALGLVISGNLATLRLTDHELEIVKIGITDGVHKAPKVPLETYGPKVNEFAQNRAKAAAEIEKKAGERFAENAAKEKGAVKKPDGLVYKELKAGTGASPKPTDKVKVNYRGTLTDGTEFDSSFKRNQPAEFQLNQVIPCWTEGVAMMKVGGKARLVCPSAIAYGERQQGPLIKPGSTLVFEVELLDILPADKPAAAK